MERQPRFAFQYGGKYHIKVGRQGAATPHRPERSTDPVPSARALDRAQRISRLQQSNRRMSLRSVMCVCRRVTTYFTANLLSYQTESFSVLPAWRGWDGDQFLQRGKRQV